MSINNLETLSRFIDENPLKLPNLRISEPPRESYAEFGNGRILFIRFRQENNPPRSETFDFKEFPTSADTAIFVVCDRATGAFKKAIKLPVSELKDEKASGATHFRFRLNSTIQTNPAVETVSLKMNSTKKYQELHDLWKTFLDKWPIERLREMTLEEYTNLKSESDEYFCHWLERKTEKLGNITGATSTKFGIYRAGKLKKKLKNGLSTDGVYVWRKPFGETKEEAFRTVREHIIKVAESAQRGEHPLKLDEVLAPMIQLKVRFLYQSKPYQILPMFSVEFLSPVAQKYLGRKCTYENLIETNLKLRKEHFPDDDVFEVMYRVLQEVWPKDGEPQNASTELKTIKELNQILYGPPGTGKTYNTIRKAVEIIDGFFDEETVNARFQELRRQNRIGFITFHQSYSYEDFVEGIRPGSANEGDAFQFGIKRGIFKEMAMSAAFDCLRDKSLKKNEGPTFSQLWEQLLVEIEENDEFSVRLKTQDYFPQVTPKGNLAAYSGERVIANCGRTIAQEAWNELYNQEEVNSGDVRRAVERGAHHHFIVAIINQLKELEKTWEQSDEGASEDSEIPLSIDQMEDAVLSFLKKGQESAYTLLPRDEHPPYVLIIDEINRGNISKILGELITLLEPDKRLGAESELTVKLPYSRHDFAVPSNLYLVGTMNTADKSIALVDVALRRRFQFEEMSPDFSICKKLPSDLRIALEGLNQRIMLRKDRDHRIGHAYFMNVDSAEAFDEIMRKKVIPLLAEYFYNDWEGLRYVLGEQGTDTRLILPIEGAGGRDRNRWQWYFDGSAVNVSPAQVLLRRLKPNDNNEGHQDS